MKKIQGLFTAMVTPFDPQGLLDEEGLRSNIRFQGENGVDGIVVLGTTGEAPTLSATEKNRIVQIAKEECLACGLHLMVGTGSYSTRQAIESTILAADLGADSALVVTPYYNKPTQEGLFIHFKAIAEASQLPIILYNIQGRCAQNIDTETLKRLADIPNIIGVKEASGQISQINDVIAAVRLQRPEFSVMSGDDALTVPLMALGGDGVISVISNLLPSAMACLVEALQEKNIFMAQEIHFELLPLIKALFIETNPIPVKWAMDQLGLPSGPLRLPLCELSAQAQEVVNRAIERSPFVTSINSLS